MQDLTLSKELLTPIGIRCDCDGTFIVTNEGIVSTKPVDIKSIKWKDDILVITGRNKSSSINIGSSGSFISIINSNNNNNVYVDGRRYQNNDVESNLEMIDINWKDSGRHNLVLSDLDLSCNSKFDIRIPLDTDCDINISGNATVNIKGHNPACNICGNISGNGNIVGNGTINKFNGNISGMGDIKGFHITKLVKVNISGMGDVNLTCDPKCKITKKVNGMGDINIVPVHK